MLQSRFSLPTLNLFRPIERSLIFGFVVLDIAPIILGTQLSTFFNVRGWKVFTENHATPSDPRLTSKLHFSQCVFVFEIFYSG